MSHSSLCTALAIATLILTPTAFSDEKPDSSARPLSQVIKMLENKGYTPIVDVELDDVELDDADWEVEAYKNDSRRELRIDPVTLEILSGRKDN